MDLDCIARLDGSKQIFKIVNAEIGMNTSLHKDLCTTLCDRLLYLFENFVFGKYVCVGTVGFAVKRAEFAFIHADIGVVDVPINNEGHKPLRVKPLCYTVRKFSQGQQVSMLEYGETFLSGKAFTYCYLGY